MNDFKSMLRYLREREKWSQSELAKRLKLSKSSISMYENGKRQPDFETLEEIADLFNVDMNFLIGKENEISRKEDALLTSFNQLTPTNQQTVLGMIDLLLSQQASEKENAFAS